VTTQHSTEPETMTVIINALGVKIRRLWTAS